MVTVIVPIAPIPTHPDSYMIEEVLDSIRYHFPDSKIILTYDAPSIESLGLEVKYNVFKAALSKRINSGEFGNVKEIFLREHGHQTVAMRLALEEVETDCLIYVEHDTPLVKTPIPWGQMEEVLLSGQSNVIRLAHTTEVPKEHLHMYLDQPGQPQIINGVPLLRLTEWSQRPHLSTTAFYKKIFRDHVRPGEKTYIEWVMYGVYSNSCSDHGWGAEYKVMLYHPEGNIERSYHLDGRKTLKKPE